MSREWDVRHLAKAATAYKQLALLICEDTRYSKALLGCVGPEDVDHVAKALVQISETMGRGPMLVRVMIEGEFERNSTVSTIFRLKSLASRTLSNYVRNTGHIYLAMVFGELLPRLISHELAVPIEVDPNKLNVADDAKPAIVARNTEVLMGVAQEIFDRITSKSMMEVMPRGFRAACHFIASSCDRHSNAFTPDDKCNLVGGFIFLRFFNPSLITPEAYDLLAPGQVPTPTTRRNLILITKLLQNLSNNIPFGQKEQFMVPMNEFLERNKPAMRAYLEALPSDPLQRPGREGWSDLDVLSPVQLPATLRDFEIRDFVVLHRVFIKHADVLREQCGEAGGRPSRSSCTFGTLLEGLGGNPKYQEVAGMPGGHIKVLGQAMSVSFDIRVGTTAANPHSPPPSPHPSPSPPSSPSSFPVPDWERAGFAYRSGKSTNGSPVLYIVVRRFCYEWLLLRDQLLAFVGGLLVGKGKAKGGGFLHRAKVAVGGGGGGGEGEGEGQGGEEGEEEGKGGGERLVDVVVDMSWAALPDDILHKFVMDTKELHKHTPTSWLQRIGRVFVVNPTHLYFVAMHTLNPVLPLAVLSKLEEIYDWKMLRGCIDQIQLPHDTRLYVPGGFTVERVARSALAQSNAARVVKVTEHSVVVINPKTNQVRHDHPLPNLLHIATANTAITLQFRRSGSKTIEHTFTLGSLEEVDALANLLLQACMEFDQQPALPWEYAVSKRNPRGRQQHRTATLGGDCVLNTHRKYVRGVIPFLGLSEVFYRGCVVHLRFKGVHELAERGERLLTTKTPGDAQNLTTHVQLGIKRERARVQQSLLKLSSQMNSSSFTSFLLAFRFGKKWLKVARAKIAERHKMILFHKQRELMVKKMEEQLNVEGDDDDEPLPDELLEDDYQAPLSRVKPSISAPANIARGTRLLSVAGDESDSESNKSEAGNSSEEEVSTNALRKVQSVANRASHAFARLTMRRTNQHSSAPSEPPPNHDDMHDAEEAVRASANDGVWVRYIADNGEPYYYNPVSGHTTWTSPGALCVPDALAQE